MWDMIFANGHTQKLIQNIKQMQQTHAIMHQEEIEDRAMFTQFSSLITWSYVSVKEDLV